MGAESDYWPSITSSPLYKGPLVVVAAAVSALTIRGLAHVLLRERHAPRPVQPSRPSRQAGRAQRRPRGVGDAPPTERSLSHDPGSASTRSGIRAPHFFSATARTRSKSSSGSGTTPPAFTLATYVHLLEDDLPDPAFLDTIIAPAGGRRMGNKTPRNHPRNI